MTSILIIAHEQQNQLALHLPTLLAQEGVEYEVVVVDMNSEDDTVQLLDALKSRNARLRYLTLPHSARDISRERLALHLGMRAALGWRVLVLNACTEITGTDWLMKIEKRWRPDADILLVPVCRDRSNGIKDYLCAGHEKWRNRLYHRQALNYGLYRAGNAIVGLNKDLFLTHNAPARHLALKNGTLDIFISHLANKYNTILLTEKELYPSEDAIGSIHVWRKKRLFDVETGRHLSKRAKRFCSYCLYCIFSIHRGSVLYSTVDGWDYLRWLFTSNKTFVKKHF